MRLCENELNLFDECVNDPVRYDKFLKLATPAQTEPKEFFSTIIRKNYLN
jgi:hypothetical protein